jgi:hypothetical protein
MKGYENAILLIHGSSSSGRNVEGVDGRLNRIAGLRHAQEKKSDQQLVHRACTDLPHLFNSADTTVAAATSCGRFHGAIPRRSAA